MLKSTVFRLLRVPHEPTPPAGSPESVRTFRASRRFFQLNLLRWVLGQAVALLLLAGVLIVEFKVDLGRATVPLRVAEGLALVSFLVQLPFSFLLIRFDYDLRWYIVTDRSLRIRHGIFTIRELTMAFPNIQQISIRQGPLQRLLGIADLEVRTAGGGGQGAGDAHGRSNSSGHLGYFRGVDNAYDLRDLILERLRLWRESGLGDPDEKSQLPRRGWIRQDDPATLAAAREVLEEVRLLSRRLVRPQSARHGGNLEAVAGAGSRRVADRP